MSERKNLRSELINAWLRMDYVIRPLSEALEYGDRYPFLWEESPGLRAQIEEKLREAEGLAKDLDELHGAVR